MIIYERYTCICPEDRAKIIYLQERDHQNKITTLICAVDDFTIPKRHVSKHIHICSI